MSRATTIGGRGRGFKSREKQGVRRAFAVGQAVPLHSTSPRLLLPPPLQVAAAAFTKGLLDLEGSSLTPILVSLVAKDASMLDAFGKVGLWFRVDPKLTYSPPPS